MGPNQGGCVCAPNRSSLRGFFFACSPLQEEVSAGRRRRHSNYQRAKKPNFQNLARARFFFDWRENPPQIFSDECKLNGNLIIDCADVGGKPNLQNVEEEAKKLKVINRLITGSACGQPMKKCDSRVFFFPCAKVVGGNQILEVVNQRRLGGSFKWRRVPAFREARQLQGNDCSGAPSNTIRCGRFGRKLEVSDDARFRGL